MGALANKALVSNFAGFYVGEFGGGVSEKRGGEFLARLCEIVISQFAEQEAAFVVLYLTFTGFYLRGEGFDGWVYHCF